MKPQLLKVSTDLIHSFSARRDTVAGTNGHWHYHPEVELIYFEKGRGIQFIGDSVQTFSEGDLILVGSNVPHYWRFDGDEAPLSQVDVKVVHFREDFWGLDFLNLPENKPILDTLSQAKRGLLIEGEQKAQVAELMNQIIANQGTKKIIYLMEALLAIHACRDKKSLVSLGFNYHSNEVERERIQLIYEYTLANFKEKISLDQIAAVAKMSSNSFCKYFKSRASKTYSRFLCEIRVSHACKLLLAGTHSVKEICYESGFYNFASFHESFKSITGKSPLQYQKSYNNK